MNYGFKAVLNTPGNVAGLGRWDEMTGLHVFHGLYGKNANVFAAVPICMLPICSSLRFML